MKKGNLINIVLVSAVIVLLGLFAFSVRVRPTADNVAVLRTSGMTSSGCSATIEKVLQGKRGVASVEVDVTAGRVIVGFDSKKTKPEDLAATVTAEGYGSSVERLLSVEQFRAMTGRNPGQGQATKVGCGCGPR
jgi:copper chaperone CopZ